MARPTYKDLEKRIRELEQAESERQKMAEDLRDSEERFRAAFMGSPNAVVISTHADGIWVDLNQAALDMFGYTRDEVIGKSVLTTNLWVDPDDRARLITALVRGDDVRNQEVRLRRKDGSIMIASVSLRALTLKGVSHLQFVTEDITRRKRVEEALAFQALLLNHIQDHVTATDPEGNIIYVNDAEVRSMKRSREELVGKPVAIYGDDPIRGATQQQIIENTLKYGEWRCEVVNHAADGTDYILDCRTKLIRDKAGAPWRMVGISTDITDRKRLDAAMRQSEKKYRQLFYEMQYGCSLQEIICDDKGNPVDYITLEVNDAFERIMGASRDAVVGKNAGDILPKEELTKWVGIFGPVALTGASTCYELYSPLNRRHYEGSAYCPEPGKFATIFSDVTDRKQAEAEHERLMSAIEQSHEAVVITDTKGTIQYVNPSFEKNTGYSKQEAIGRNPRFLKSGVQDETFYRNLWETITTGKTWTGRLVNRKKDGSIFTEDASISPVRDYSGTIINYVGVKRDITREMDAENRLLQAQRIEAIGALAGGIAHDFNNILYPITGMAEMLLEDLPKDSPEYENAEEILIAARRGGALVKQILSFSRQSNQRKVPVRLQQILKEVLKLSRATIPSNIRFHSEIQTDCGPILADPTQLHQILMNLITNAYHAVEETGGDISIGVKEAEVADPADNALAPGKYAQLTIWDNGHGIDPAVINRIFEPYFTTKPQGKGTGLGLSVAYGIVKEHGGDIRVTSDPGKGSTFTVHLPLLAGAPEAEAPGEAPIDPTGNERILLVDDEEAVVRLETKMLERLGYKVTSRTGSVEALGIFSAHPDRFDAVITDMTMPGLTGDQLAGKLLALRPDIPVIISTGFNEKMNAEKAKAIGIKGFLMKPVVKSELAVMLRRLLDEKDF